MTHLREGDTFVIDSMDRLFCSLTDLINTVKGLTAKGVKVQLLSKISGLFSITLVRLPGVTPVQNL